MGKCIGHQMCVSFLSTISGQNIFHSDKYLISYAEEKCTDAWSSCGVHCCVILTKIGIFQQILVKHSNITFHEIPFSGFRVVCRQTDWHCEAKAHFCNFPL
jgi:hypothetical protein